MSMWDWEALWLKAKKFIDKANEEDRDDPDFGCSQRWPLSFLAARR